MEFDAVCDIWNEALGDALTTEQWNAGVVTGDEVPGFEDLANTYCAALSRWNDKHETADAEAVDAAGEALRDHAMACAVARW